MRIAGWLAGWWAGWLAGWLATWQGGCRWIEEVRERVRDGSVRERGNEWEEGVGGLTCLSACLINHSSILKI